MTSTVFDLMRDPSRTLIAAWVIAGVAHLIALVWQYLVIHAHLQCPESTLRSYYLKILVMFPVFTHTAYFCMFFPEMVVVLELIRQTVECFALYFFFYAMLELAGGEVEAPTMLAQEPPSHVWATPPLCCCFRCFPETTLDHKKLDTLRWMVLQLCIILPGLALLDIFLQRVGYFDEGVASQNNAFIFIRGGSMISMMVAVWALFVLYRATHRLLENFQTTRKFLLIKGIVVIVLTQEFFMSILVSKAVIQDSGDGVVTADMRANILNNFLICLEMVPAAYLMQYGFPVSDYEDAKDQRRFGSSHVTSSIAGEGSAAEVQMKAYQPGYVTVNPLSSAAGVHVAAVEGSEREASYGTAKVTNAL